MICIPINPKEDEGKSTFSSNINLKYILKKENSNLNELIFIVPYSNDIQSTLLNILTHIKNKINNPKFLITFNKIDPSNEENNTELNQSLSKARKFVKTSMHNKCNIFYDTPESKTVLIHLKEQCTIIKHYSPSELTKLWRQYGGIQGDNITKSEYSQYLAYQKELLNIGKSINDTNALYLEIKQ